MKVLEMNNGKIIKNALEDFDKELLRNNLCK